MDINFMELLQPELLILIAVIYGLGMFFKKIPNFPDWMIPIILLIISVALTIVYKAIVLGKGFCSTTIVNGIIYGIIIATVAVFTNQVIKQVTVNRVEDND